jgi:DNA-binding MarR family transcriptional regulator
MAQRENRAELYGTLAQRAGIALEPSACWLLYRLADQPEATVASVAARLKADPARIERGIDALVEAGYIQKVVTPAGEELHVTVSGTDAISRLVLARQAGMAELLEGWDIDDHPEIMEMVRNLAHSLLADDERLLADARAVPVSSPAA